MSQSMQVDCTPLQDQLGRTMAPALTYRTMTQAEETQRSTDAAVEATFAAAVATAIMPRLTIGRVTLTVLDGVSKVVVFAQTMHSADYAVMLSSTTSLSVSLWTTNHTASGFTLNVSAAISATIEYLAQEVT